MTVSWTHRRFRRAGLGALLVGLVFLAFGCGSSQANRRPLDTSFIVPGKTTKEEVYQRLGMPETLYFPGFPMRDRLWYFEPRPGVGLNTVGKGKPVSSALFYTPSHGKAAQLGLGTMAGVLFLMGHQQVGLETIAVLLDKQQRVMGVWASRKADYVTRRLWPFGA